MDIFDFFNLALKARINEGTTQTELAKQAGKSQSTINAMLNGTKQKQKAKAKTAKEVIQTTEFQTLVKLFPEIFDEILKKYGAQGGGAGQAIVNSPGAATVNGNANSVHIAQGAVDWAGVMTAIRKDKKMCAECKLRAMDIIDESNNGGRG